MRQAESEYWDKQASTHLPKLTDNVQKRGALVEKLLKHGDLFKQRILEVGVGLGTAMAALQIVFLRNFNYAATDVSEVYTNLAKKRIGDQAFHTDICHLPETDGGFTRIIFLDSLEHVSPEDRAEGFKEVEKVMAEHCKILINLPCDEGSHDKEFDHPFDIHEIIQLADATKTEVVYLEKYQVMCNTGLINYKWVILER